jgi:hypothetical protein
MTEKEVVSELKKSGADQLIKDLGTRGVDFDRLFRLSPPPARRRERRRPKLRRWRADRS